MMIHVRRTARRLFEIEKRTNTPAVMVTTALLSALVGCATPEREYTEAAYQAQSLYTLDDATAATADEGTCLGEGTCNTCPADDSIVSNEEPAPFDPPTPLPAPTETSHVGLLTRAAVDNSKVGWGVFQCTNKDNKRDMWQVKCPPNQVATCEKDAKKQVCVAADDPTNPPAPANGNIIGYVGAIVASGCVGAAVNNWGGSTGTLESAANLEKAAKAFCAAKRGTESACQAYFTKACERATGGLPSKKNCLEWTFLACRACPAN